MSELRIEVDNDGNAVIKGAVYPRDAEEVARLREAWQAGRVTNRPAGSSPFIGYGPDLRLYLHDPSFNRAPTWDEVLVPLSRTYRWTASTDWSVVDHLVLCGMISEDLDHGPVARALVVSHDFEEAFLGDISRPLRGLIAEGTDELDVLSDAVRRKVRKTFGLPSWTADVGSEAVAQVDVLAALAESAVTGQQYHDPETAVEHTLLIGVVDLMTLGEKFDYIMAAFQRGVTALEGL
jgi:hypothetical protein